MVASKLLLAITTIGLALPAQAAPAPIVFDFEDGLQGWELHGAATRVQTQVLGGEWAMFGDGFAGGSLAFISLTIDLTNIDFISVDQFFAGEILGRPDGTDFLTGELEGFLIIRGNLVSSDLSNPGRREIPLGIFPFNLRGLWDVRFYWLVVPLPDDFPPDYRLGFIDNITFHPVPEPGTLSLLALSLGTLATYRRRIV